MKEMGTHARRRAFTLIELLIVVAIIAILAAIAVPNFLDAQLRAKTSRLLADWRSLITAMESYRVDFNLYINPYYPDAPGPETNPDMGMFVGPHMHGAFLSLEAEGEPNAQGGGNARRWDFYRQHIGNQLTTPVQYVGGMPEDPFWTTFFQNSRIEWMPARGGLAGLHFKSASSIYTGAVKGQPRWASNAPPIQAFKMQYWLYSCGPNAASDQGSYDSRSHIYDPTNGTISDGDIHYFHPYGFCGAGFYTEGADKG